MKLNNTVVTLALLGVLALAALAGGLLPAGNPVHAQEATTTNRPPAFATETTTRSIEENTPPGVNIGDPVTATDPDEDSQGDDDREFGETLTYTLEGADADSFNLDPLTSQLSTRAALDFEAHTDPTSAYSVTVRVRDSRGLSDTIVVTIEVTNDGSESPSAPAAPTVVSGSDLGTSTEINESTTSLKVVWHPPENMGDRTIVDYEYRYRRTTGSTWTTGVPSVADTTVTISIPHLVANTTYLVSVRANSAEGTSPWSLSGTGATNRTGNSPPAFGIVTNPSVNEDSPAGQNVGLAVRASDSDTGSLSYRLEGPDAAIFDFITSTGQIRTKRGVTYNREDPACGFVATAVSPTCTYYVTVAAYDGAGGSDAVRLEIDVNNQSEAPSTPAAPTVRAMEGETTSLDVSWNPPANAGPPITRYNVQYRRRGSTEDFSSDGVIPAGASATISGNSAETDDAGELIPWLMRGTRYEVRVQAVNAEGSSLWSSLGTGSTNLGNLEPRFRRRPNTGDSSTRNSTLTISLIIAENASSGSQVGTVAADDGNGDARTYQLSGDDAAALALFEINESTGQVRTMSALNHEDTACGYDDDAATTVCTYTVTVEVRDGYGPNRERVEEASNAPDDRVTVAISVRDVREPPAKPTVTVTSPTNVTNLIVTWGEPVNTGPDITGYDVEYRQGNAAWSDDNCRGTTDTKDNCDDIPPTDTTTTITGLAANTSYSVRVRATNSEGDSAWTMVTGSTNRNRADDSENDAPVFDSDTNSRNVNENTPSGQSIGNPISAGAGDEGDRLTYSLEGADRSSFSIDRNTGQIRTSARLNHEDPACKYVSTAETTECTYNVRVKVVDGQGGSASQSVTITVGDLPEVPSAPAPPKVTATRDSGLSLEVTWNEPRDTGKPPVTDYEIQYRLYRPSNQETFQGFVHTGTETSATITELDPRTSYEVQVLTVNHEGRSIWSNAGRGTTGASNTRPAFEDTTDVTRNVVENARPGQDVGSPVSATDEDGDRLSYSLSGPDASSFDINRSSGLIRTRSGVSYDFESKPSYSVTVRVDDGQRKANSVEAKSVTIELDNLDEPPSTPNAPRVTGVPGLTDSIRVTWDEPANTGPSITFYNLQHGPAGTGFVPLLRNIVDRSTIITGLEAGTRYGVQVRAHNAEGQSQYSRSGTGAPNADVANRNPRFTGGTRSFSVAEDTGAGEAVGDPVEAIDDDDDPMSYSLAGTDAASFDIDSVSGQIRTREALNFEEKSSHSVTVRVRDNRGGSGTVDVRITVTDVDEPPDTPDAPTVTALSSASLQVTWDEPGNTGPPITDYDYRYRGPTGDWTEVTNTTIRETTATIEGLTASTFYDVSVRARNAEGTSDWSNSGFGSTNAPGANNPPVFTEGASATRSVSASASAGTSIGLPVRATDADSGDTITYTIEGRDAALFDIGETNGQLLTRSGVTLIAAEAYTVTVVADDGKDRALITVTIEATAAPPNNPPVFREGTSATRTVARSAPAGTAIGRPVTATDTDAGATLTYSLEGTDAASFSIVASSGQIRTRATLDRTRYTVEVVASDGTARTRITVTINVTLNNAPVFSGGPRSFTVRDNASAGTPIGSPVRATDADGDTLTYSLEGTNAAAFDIRSNTGQIVTRAGVTLTVGTTHSVTVAATDGNAGRATVAVTITVIQGEFGCDTRGAVSDASNTGLVSDCEALLGARNVLEGNGRLNWSERTPIAEWDGIRSDSLEGTPARVTRLYLHRSGLRGSIPAELGQVSELKWLYLHANDLTGEIPGALNNLSKLERLYVYDNKLTGISGQLGSGMAQLRRLFAQRNRITGSIPAGLGDMPRLDFLRLDRNRLTGSIPSQLGSLSTLRRLYLHEQAGWRVGGGLTGRIPTSLGNMSRLEYLVLNRNSLSGTIPDSLGGLSNLKWLGLYDNSLSGSMPSQLGNMSSLERLYLHGNQLSGSIPSEVGNMSALTNLWLKGNQLTGDIPDNLGNLNLNRLRISGNTGLTGCVPVGLVPTRSLTDSRGRVTQPSNDIAESHLEVCSGS